MAKTISQEDFARRMREMLESAEATRKQTLQRFADEAEAEEQALSQVRDELAKRVGAEDPRVKALERRAAGSRKVRDFAREGAKGPGDGGPGGPGKPPEEVKLEVKVVRVGQRSRQVVGKVTDASGSPLPGLKLELYEKGSDKPAFNATTNEKGEFAFMDVSAGALTVKLHVGDKVIEKKVSSR
jgi:hypothetical protein